MARCVRACVVVADGVQYCQWETFNASCASRGPDHVIFVTSERAIPTDRRSRDRRDHVILMTSARYGRMRFGRCMREDHGSVGCSAAPCGYDSPCAARS